METGETLLKPAPWAWGLLSLLTWGAYVALKGWKRLSIWDRRQVAFAIFTALLFLNFLTHEEFKGWSDVYYFCGSQLQYCTCSFRWNARGWAKAYILWSFVLTSAAGLQRLLIQVGLNGLLPGEEVVTRESVISICWRLIPYWLNNWEQQWGAECSSMMFELPHFAVELLVILPCIQILCARLKVLVMPLVHMGRVPQPAGPQQQQQQPAGVAAADGEQPGRRRRGLGMPRDELAPNILRGYWEHQPQQKRLLPRLRANLQVMLFALVVTALAATNALMVPLLLESTVSNSPVSRTIQAAGKHPEWFTNSSILNMTAMEQANLTEAEIQLLNTRLVSYHQPRPHLLPNSRLLLSLLHHQPSHGQGQGGAEAKQARLPVPLSLSKGGLVHPVLQRVVQHLQQFHVDVPLNERSLVSSFFHFHLHLVHEVLNLTQRLGGDLIDLVTAVLTAASGGVDGKQLPSNAYRAPGVAAARALDVAAGHSEGKEGDAAMAAAAAAGGAPQHMQQQQQQACPGHIKSFRTNLLKHSEEITKMQAQEHRSLIPLVESALAVMRLSCEKYFVLLTVFVAHLVFKEHPPRLVRSLIHMNARLSSIFQKVILYSFPAVCWVYGAGVLFSLFVSTVFWGGPLMAMYESLRLALTAVRIKSLKLADEAALERMGGNCAICWGEMHVGHPEAGGAAAADSSSGLSSSAGGQGAREDRQLQGSGMLGEGRSGTTEGKGNGGRAGAAAQAASQAMEDTVVPAAVSVAGNCSSARDNHGQEGDGGAADSTARALEPGAPGLASPGRRRDRKGRRQRERKAAHGVDGEAGKDMRGQQQHRSRKEARAGRQRRGHEGGEVAAGGIAGASSPSRVSSSPALVEISRQHQEVEVPGSRRREEEASPSRRVRSLDIRTHRLSMLQAELPLVKASSSGPDLAAPEASSLTASTSGASIASPAETGEELQQGEKTTAGQPSHMGETNNVNATTLPPAAQSGAIASRSGVVADEAMAPAGVPLQEQPAPGENQQAAATAGQEQVVDDQQEEVLGESSRAWSLPCGHAYHHACLSQWLGQCHTNGVAPTCPMCQARIQLEVKWRFPIPWHLPADDLRAAGQQPAPGDAQQQAGPGGGVGAGAAGPVAAPGDRNLQAPLLPADTDDEDADDAEGVEQVGEIMVPRVMVGGLGRQRPAGRVRAHAGGQAHENLLLPPPLAALGGMSMLRLLDHQREIQELLADMPQIAPPEDVELLQQLAADNPEGLPPDLNELLQPVVLGPEQPALVQPQPAAVQAAVRPQLPLVQQAVAVPNGVQNPAGPGHARQPPVPQVQAGDGSAAQQAAVRGPAPLEAARAAESEGMLPAAGGASNGVSPREAAAAAAAARAAAAAATAGAAVGRACTQTGAPTLAPASQLEPSYTWRQAGDAPQPGDVAIDAQQARGVPNMAAAACSASSANSTEQQCGPSSAQPHGQEARPRLTQLPSSAN